MSNLVAHAERELAIIGEDPETVQGYLDIVKRFADMGHSGGSASIAIPTITALLSFENISPLTDNPDEWHYHGSEMAGCEGGFWQNKRNGEAFSHDGGKTYYLLSEGGSASAYLDGEVDMHVSRSSKRVDEIKEILEADRP